MLKILGKIPSGKFHVACSGGSDSMVMLDFLMKYPKNDFDVIHFDHGTECCVEAVEFITDFCGKHGIDCHVGRISGSRAAGQSREEYWRNARYEFFAGFSDRPIILSHHLNDAIETWIMTSMHGNPQIIPYRNPKYNVIRPFLSVPKTEIAAWAKRHSVEYVVDRSNYDVNIRRNYVRHELMPHIYKLNPGIEKTVWKQVMRNFKDSFRENSRS